MKSWNLNFLEPSGPLQACNRTALPFIHKHSAYVFFFGHFKFPGPVKPSSNPNKIIKDQYYDHQLSEHQHKPNLQKL
jgi:hypothetical protein